MFSTWGGGSNPPYPARSCQWDYYIGTYRIKRCGSVPVLDTGGQGSTPCILTMPYKDKNLQRKFNREWCAKRRSEFFNDKSCIKCGSLEKLELDHIDPKTKTTNRIWSWSLERRKKEISKCQVLCNSCHKNKTKQDYQKLFCKIGHEYSKTGKYFYKSGKFHGCKMCVRNRVYNCRKLKLGNGVTGNTLGLGPRESRSDS